MTATAITVIRALGAGALGGIVAGVLVGGIGGRIAMRISAIAAGPGMVGSFTENGNRVGDITIGGTLALIVFGGIFQGILGGILYIALRPWLSRLGAWRGLAFGGILLALLGWTVIDRDNFDFRIFGPPALNVALFAAIFVSFGAAVAPLADRIERASSPGTGSQAALVATFVGGLFALFVLGLGAVSSVAALAGDPSTDLRLGLLIYGTLALAIAGRAWLARGGRAAFASAAALSLPIVVGLDRTVTSIARILGM